MLIIKIIKIKCSNPSRILNEQQCIYSCLQTPPRENWFQYVRRVYTTAINFSYITALHAPLPPSRTPLHILDLKCNLERVPNFFSEISFRSTFVRLLIVPIFSFFFRNDGIVLVKERSFPRNDAQPFLRHRNCGAVNTDPVHLITDL